MSPEYYQLNKSRLRAVALDRYHRNKSSAPRKKYAADAIRQNSYAKNREKTDVAFKIKRRLRFRLWKATAGKGGGALKLLGCTIDEFRTHIQKLFKFGMNWGNYGLNGWHIDHIKPCASFDLTDPLQRSECFHYSNMQPLWESENCSKKASLSPKV